LNAQRVAIRRHWLCVLLLSGGFACAQDVTLTARVTLVNSDRGSRQHEAGDVVLWLTPLAGAESANLPPVPESSRTRLVQHNKSFQPHVLVVPVGSVVAFPNRDPFFHNVFSLFEGKRFDLGLYEAGSTRDVQFDKAGVSYIFCNIHPEMSAVVIAVDTRYYGISDPRGEVVIPHVPPGRYTLRIWYEAAMPEALKSLTRDITVSEANSTLGLLRLTELPTPPPHKNLYGRDYDPPTPDSPAYERH
jgi:plastocyanin